MERRPPGRRPRPIWRILRIVAGFALLLFGTIGLFLPVLQGVLMILAGLAVTRARPSLGPRRDRLARLLRPPPRRPSGRPSARARESGGDPHPERVTPPAPARRAPPGTREEIRRHDRLYYGLDDPEISDAAYDRLFWELARSNANIPSWFPPIHPRSGSRGRWRRASPKSSTSPRCCRCKASTTRPSSASSPPGWSARSAGSRSPTAWSPNSTASRSSWCTNTAGSSGGRRAGTARSARTSPGTCAPSARCRSASRAGRSRTGSRCGARPSSRSLPSSG